METCVPLTTCSFLTLAFLKNLDLPMCVKSQTINAFESKWWKVNILRKILGGTVLEAVARFKECFIFLQNSFTSFKLLSQWCNPFVIKIRISDFLIRTIYLKNLICLTWVLKFVIAAVIMFIFSIWSVWIPLFHTHCTVQPLSEHTGQLSIVHCDFLTCYL